MSVFGKNLLEKWSYPSWNGSPKSRRNMAEKQPPATTTAPKQLSMASNWSPPRVLNGFKQHNKSWNPSLNDGWPRKSQRNKNEKAKKLGLKGWPFLFYMGTLTLCVKNQSCTFTGLLCPHSPSCCWCQMRSLQLFNCKQLRDAAFSVLPSFTW